MTFAHSGKRPVRQASKASKLLAQAANKAGIRDRSQLIRNLCLQALTEPQQATADIRQMKEELRRLRAHHENDGRGEQEQLAQELQEMKDFIAQLGTNLRELIEIQGETGKKNASAKKIQSVAKTLREVKSDLDAFKKIRGDMAAGFASVILALQDVVLDEERIDMDEVKKLMSKIFG